MTGISRTCDLERLRALLEAHGSNPMHWPVADAARLAAFARNDAEARRLIAETQAFDKVLAAAPSVRSDRMVVLLDRVMASIEAPRPQLGPPAAGAGGAHVVGLPPRAREVSGPTAFRRRRLWPIYGALAASLILGFYVGISGYAVPALQQVAGLQDEADTSLPGQPVADEGQEGELL